MKRTLLLAAMAVIAVSCRNRATDKADWEITVDEMENSFSFQNSLAGYSMSLQQQEETLTSMGFNVWLAGREEEEGSSIGFDGMCLGVGGSAPLGTSGFYFPEKIDRKFQLLMHSPDRAVMAVFYPKTDILGTEVSLDKQITMTAGSPFIQVIDHWDGVFEGLNVVAGAVCGDTATVSSQGRVLQVTYANDLNVVIVMPEADRYAADGEAGHAYLGQTVTPGTGMYYYVGLFDGDDASISHLTDSILNL